jgi:ABC-type glycerol-3-phosphate transport system substrate-binding protein
MTSKTPRRAFLRTALFASMSLLVASCQPRDDGATPVPTAEVAPKEATPVTKETAAIDATAKPASEDRLPVKIWMSDDWSGQADRFEAYRAHVQSCAEEIDLEVEYRVVDYTTIGQQIPILMASGRYTADIVPGGSRDVVTYGRIGQLRDMRPLLSESMLNRMLPSLRDLGMVGDKLYALVVWPSWIIGFYNKELYQKAGLNPDQGPQTLKEMEEHIVALQGVAALPYLDTWKGTDILRAFRNVVYAKDGKMYEGATKEDPDNIEWTFVTPECKETLNWIKHMYDEKLVSPDSVQLTQQDVAERFGQGDVGMTTNWDGFASISEKPGSPIQGKIGAFGFPGDAPGKAVGYYYDEVMLMPASAQNPEGAARWIECIQRPEITKERAISQYFNPVYADQYQDPEIQKALFYWKVIEEISPRSIPINYHASQGQVHSFLTAKIQEVMLGQTDVDAALAEVQKFAEEVG